MKLFPANTQTSTPADPARSTGEVWTDHLADGARPHRTHMARVAFSPGAPTAWHTHPCGQILHGVSGLRLVCNAEEKPILLKAGDTIAIGPERTLTRSVIWMAIMPIQTV